MKHPRYRNLVNRTAMASSIETLSPSETEAMLKHRWIVAGGKEIFFRFTSDAIEQTFNYSKGIPRTQIIIVDNSLLAAFLLGQKLLRQRYMSNQV